MESYGVSSMKPKYFILIETEEIDVVKRQGPFSTLAEAFGVKQKTKGLLVKEVKTKVVEEA